MPGSDLLPIPVTNGIFSCIITLRSFHFKVKIRLYITDHYMEFHFSFDCQSPYILILV